MLTFNETIDSFFRTIPSKVFVNDEIRKLSYRELVKGYREFVLVAQLDRASAF